MRPRLPLAVGRARALELICTGRIIDASEMERLGLVQAVVDGTQLATATRDMAETIASSGPLAIRGAKRIMSARTEPGFRAARELSDALHHALEWSADVDEGIAAHRDGRPPSSRDDNTGQPAHAAATPPSEESPLTSPDPNAFALKIGRLSMHHGEGA